MTDSKTVVQEVQDQLLAIVHRGQDQVRKGQDQVRKRQEQVRKGREAVAGAVRTGSELAKSVRQSAVAPALKTLPSAAEVRAHAQELASHAVNAQRSLAGRARHAATPYAEQVLTAQRNFAEKVIEAARAATPFVAEGRARLSQVVGALQDTRRPGQPTAASAAPTADEAAERLVAHAAATEESVTSGSEPEPAADGAAMSKAAKPRARTSKADGASAGAKAAARKPAAKAAPAKRSTTTSRTTKK
jgi:DNA-binding protein HU-beta